MEAFSLLRPAPQRTMADVHMDLHMQVPQQSLLPQSIPLAPGKRFLPDSSHEECRKLKRGGGNEEKKGEDEDGELLFDIDEFLVEEEEALFRGNNIHQGNGNVGATIISESPTNENPNSDPSTMIAKESNGNTDCPFPDVASTNTAIINAESNITITNIDDSDSSTAIHKKKRKKRTRPKGKPNSTDDLTPPKRPLSAYNLYFREERKRCIAEASSNPFKKYNFEELGKLIGKGWRSLPLKEKCKLETRAEADRERYRNEMIAYRSEKRRRAREEDNDSLILMQRHHQRGGQITPCPHSPQDQAHQHLAGSFSPKRPGEQYLYRRYVTVSPGHRDYQVQQEQLHPLQQKEHLHPPDSTRRNHVRKVSVSTSSPPYTKNSPNYRSVNNASPGNSSYGSCSSWSGDEVDGDRNGKHKRRHENKNNHGIAGISERDIASQAQGDNTKNTYPNKAVAEHHPPAPSNDPRYSLQGSRKPQATTSPQRVPVARVVAMPATDGLQRMLQDGRSQQVPPQPAHAWMPWPHVPSSHNFSPYYPPPPHRQCYSPLSPSPVSADQRMYSPPPPPQSSFVPGPQHFSPNVPVRHEGHQMPTVPQMLPLGMSILLRDPVTGQERSYRIQYAPKFMTPQEATQFQISHGGDIGIDDKEQTPT